MSYDFGPHKNEMVVSKSFYAKSFTWLLVVPQMILNRKMSIEVDAKLDRPQDLARARAYSAEARKRLKWWRR